MKISLLLFCIYLIALPATTLASSGEKAFSDSISAAMNDKDRPENDQQRDQNRLPLETLKFFGLREDMTVIDILPGGGYYTRLLAPALKDKGQLYLAVGTGNIKKNLLLDDDFKEVKLLSENTTIKRPEGERHYQLGDLDFGKVKADMVTSFRALHLHNAEDRIRLNKALFKALKPGGIYAVIDHTARHGEPATEENRRRLDPVVAIMEIQAAGFILADMSTMHYRPQDDLSLEVGNEKVKGQTDRWTLKFVKPVTPTIK
ncbi:Predicted methyltransferase [Alteromonadaceae bacterium Bs31]|nr:Predicted methyltransferase [Alteromonadaceae bacterium Bs31]